jgi:RimJ/RimL family protein N-acetyltransferase
MQPVRLNPSHAVEYRGLMLEAYAQHPDAFTSSLTERACLPFSWWEQRLAEGDTPGEIVLGSFVSGQLAGVVGLSFERREKIRHKATLFGMYVPAGFRKTGLGTRLVRQALDSAKARPGVSLVQLTMTDGNRAAQALYQRHGFVSFGLEPNAVAVGDGFVSKLHMWCNLASQKHTDLIERSQ